MRSKGSVEGALVAKAQSGQGGTWKKNEKNKKGNSGSDSLSTNKGTKSDFPPCKHCQKKGHPPWKCWRKPDQQCEKCQKMDIIKKSVKATLNRRL